MCRSIPRCACALVLLILGGCATHAHQLTKVRELYCAGELAEATSSVDKALKRPHNDGDVLRLEHAMLDLCEGRTREAEQTLRQVRDRFDTLEQASLGRSALSMLTDDNMRDYPGEDYERVLVRAFLALSNLMNGGEDAQAYSLQITDKQQQIIDAAKDRNDEESKLAYKQVALGPYLRGMLREETHSNYDDVQRASATVVSWQPNFVYGLQDLERARHGHHSAPGNGVLYVFALTGLGPYKEETMELPSTVALLIADQILSATNKYTLPPTIAPIKVPKVVVPTNQIDRVRVFVDRQPVGETATITNIGEMAREQYEAVYPHVIARAVVRRVVKKGVIYGTKTAMNIDRNSLWDIGLDVVGVAWEATEAADTRCWGLLPEKIQVLRVELPQGEHEIALQGVGSTLPGTPRAERVTITNGRNTYMLANFPDMDPIGKILVNQRR
ncbi:MAG TPA: hypothetical protein VHD36_03060 [Pirellulales bacterium]|nr:hypothetical protein [Pirellulales bacterium]